MYRLLDPREALPRAPVLAWYEERAPDNFPLPRSVGVAGPGALAIALHTFAPKQATRAQSVSNVRFADVVDDPRLEMIVINMGVGEATQDKKKVEAAAAEMQQIAGQKPVITKAKKSIAQFKLREGMPIGCKVTLRRDRMYEFLDRLVTIALPRVRDFRGLNPKSFDGRGNYAMGLKEQIIFPEINYDQIDKVRGMDVIITTTAKSDEEARELLRLFNFPFPAEEQREAA